MKIPFDIKYRPQIESGEYKVETIDGHSVRIICWDAVNASDDDIVALVKSIYGNENICRYYANGHLVSDSANMGNKDLVIVTPEPELSEFEKRLVKFYHDRNDLPYDKDGVYNRHDLDELLHNTAAELLAIAREELTPKFGKEYEDGYLDGFEHGKDKALNDLPRWIPNKFDKHNFETCKAYLDTPRYLCYQDKMIDVSKLVEKLPGFKAE